MRVLLLGGIGYLGGRLAQHLTARGHDVRVTTRSAAETVPSWVSAGRVYQTDLRPGPELTAALEGADVVFHLAAPGQESATKDPAGAVRFGAEGTWHIAEAVAKTNPAAALIYVSTYHVYGRNLHGRITEETPPAPLHPYGVSKQMGEHAVQYFRRTAGLRALCVRLSNAFGAPAGSEITQWSLVFNDLCRQAVNERAIRLRSSGLQKRSFITMGDAVAAFEHLAAHPEAWPEDGVMHVGSSSLCLGIRDVAEIVAERAAVVLGYRPEITAPGPAAGERVTELTFVVDRLAATGFAWKNEMEAEVDATLRLCDRIR